MSETGSVESLHASVLSPQGTPRPWTVTVGGVVAAVLGLANALAGVAICGLSSEANYQERKNLPETSLILVGSAFIAIGLVTLLLIAGTIRGSAAARTALSALLVVKLLVGAGLLFAFSGTTDKLAAGSDLILSIVALLLIWLGPRSAQFFDGR